MKEGARKGAESRQRLITTGQLGIGSQGGTWCLVVAVLALSCPRPSGLANTRSKWLCGPAVCVLSLKSGLSTEESDLPLASWYSEDPEELADQWLGTGNSTKCSCQYLGWQSAESACGIEPCRCPWGQDLGTEWVLEEDQWTQGQQLSLVFCHLEGSKGSLGATGSTVPAGRFSLVNPGGTDLQPRLYCSEDWEAELASSSPNWDTEWVQGQPWQL